MAASSAHLNFFIAKSNCLPHSFKPNRTASDSSDTNSISSRLRTPVETALRDAMLSIKDIDEVILVDGSTRIPAIQDLVRKMIGKEPNVTVNLDEVVALGAAVQCSMGDSETGSSKFSFQVKNNDRMRLPKSFDPAAFVHLPNKLQNYLKSQLQRLGKNDKAVSWVGNVQKEDSRRSSAFEVDLDRQMQAWKENPSWVDQKPLVKVSVPKGSLCNLIVKLNVGLPPDAVYNIVIDPDNKRVFKNIKEVISRKVMFDDGQRQVVDLEQAAIWRFLWWSGTISVHVLVDQNRKDHSMKFKQVKTGFMKRFEGCWRVEPLFVDEMTCAPFKPKTMQDYDACTGGKGRIGSVVSLEQIIEPAIIPPPPISWYLRGITTRTTEMLIHDLCEETARIRGGFVSEKSEKELNGATDKCMDSVTNLRDIKERWAQHRRNAKHCQRRLLFAK